MLSPIMSMNYKSICIVGVDGAGKSSVIEKIKMRLGEERVSVQYMGSREWETAFAKKYHEIIFSSRAKHPILVILSYIYEMYHRVEKHKGTNKLVVFDRYVDEQVLIRKKQRGGINKKVIVVLYTVFLQWLFHKPDAYFYLTCPVEVSVRRKDDISSEKEIQSLRNNKTMLDNYYMKKENVTVIDTSIYNQEETLNIILRGITNL